MYRKYTTEDGRLYYLTEKFMSHQYLLENDYLIIELSTAGNGLSVLSIYNKRTGKEWIYTDRDKLKIRTPEGTYDNQYYGGCEFIFPNDMPEMVEGLQYQDHGLLWTTEFTTSGLQAAKNSLSYEFAGYLKEWKVKAHITIELSKYSPVLTLTISFKNESSKPYPYLLRLHPSFAVCNQSKLYLNGRTIHFDGAAGADFCSFKPDQMLQSYPFIQTDKGQFSVENLPSTDITELFCHIDQQEGGFFIKDGKEQLKASYKREDFPYLTVYYIRTNQSVAMLEPDTGRRADLTKQIDLKENRTIFPFQEKQYTVTIEVN